MRDGIYELNTDESGQLKVAAVHALFPQANFIKYKNTNNNSFRVCSRLGELFEAPEGGWNSTTVYMVNVPGAAPAAVPTAPAVSAAAGPPLINHTPALLPNLNGERVYHFCAGAVLYSFILI